MFNTTSNKLLKDLQDVQAKIRKHNEILKGYKVPTTKLRMANDILQTLKMLMYGEIDINAFVQYNHLDFDYIEELGTYFVNIAKYQQDTKKYQEELRDIKQYERNLKNALGID